MVFDLKNSSNLLIQQHEDILRNSISNGAINQLGKTFFAIRVIDDWNSLPEDIISTKTVLQFKTKLDIYWKDKRFNTSEIY